MSALPGQGSRKIRLGCPGKRNRSREASGRPHCGGVDAKDGVPFPDGGAAPTSYNGNMTAGANRPYRWVPVGLLERDEQLATLLDRFNRVDKTGQLVLVSGEAGAGKTALVQAFTERHLGDRRVWLGRCDDLFAARPLGPFV